MIFWSPPRGEKATWQFRADSVQIAARNPAQVDEAGIPMRYNAEQQTGVSDHLPLVTIIETTQNQ